MIKNIFKLFSLLIFLFGHQLFAQQKNIWSKIDEAKISNTQLQRSDNVKKYQTFQLKVNDLKNSLQNAPNNDIALETSSFKIQFPDKNGKMISFLVKESPVMHPDLAKDFPENKSYTGMAVTDNSIRIRFSVNELGLHAMIIGRDRKIQYIDPLTKDFKNYRVYSRKDMDFEDNEFQCFTKSIKTLKKSGTGLKIANDKKLRTFRLALAATGEYSQFHIDQAGLNGGTDNQKKAAVLAAMTTAMTRINALFENDLAVTLQLIPNNTNIIFLDPDTDPYTNGDGNVMLGENQTTCTDVIGSKNYDIGHVLSTDGGGVASLKSACNSVSKARGVTGLASPTGDNFYFDFIAHEMGHQLGANHCFNGDDGNCAGSNRNSDTAVEPGSGSTIMAYAGLCFSQNVQSHSDLYFHIISINEIWDNITVGIGTCGVATDLTSNSFVPTANAGNDFTIPISTAYTLKGQGNDADGDPISFSWEQIDNQITNIPPSETATSGALYRSVNPAASGNRSLPDLNTLINGNISSTWEVTPSVAREINFNLTVRDNNMEAGQVASDDLKVTVTDAAGPFIVTSQNIDNLVWTKNTNETITWDVAGTTGNGVNVSNVNILLSIDGGKTFPIVLASNTSNDGSQSITVPNAEASKCFVMVEAIGNFFFALNTKNFSIGEFNEICNTYPAMDTPLPIPDNNSNGVTSTISVPDIFNIEKVSVSIAITHTFVGDLTITLESPSGNIIELISKACSAGEDINVTLDDDGIDLTCAMSSPVITGTIKSIQELSNFIGESSSGIWKLNVEDNEAIDIGSLESWSLELCTSEPVLAVNTYVFKDFKVYPNPSAGIFDIEFTSRNTSDVEILIFDLLGRRITQKVIKTNSPYFKEKFNMDQISSGIYILQVKRGNEISSQKLRIK